jgi:hypothetical protein
MATYPSKVNKDAILIWCLANANALRVYADGWVMCDITAYNTANVTDFVEETYIPVYYFPTRWTSQQGYVGFSFLESWQTEEASNTLIAPLKDEKRAQYGVNSGLYIVIDNTSLANPFDNCFYNYLTRRGDPCAFDPAECCGSSSSSGPEMITLLANTINENQNHSISPILLTNAAGGIPSASDTIKFQFFQNGTNGQFIAEAEFAGGADITLGVSAPTSSSANLAFTRPDAQNVSLVDFNTAIGQYMNNAVYTGASGNFQIQEFDKIQWAMDFAVRIGPIDGYLANGNMTLDKIMVITITTNTDSKVYIWKFESTKLDKGWTYTTYLDCLTDGQDIGMGFVTIPGSGLWTGNLFYDIKQLQPLVVGNISSSASRPAVGTLRLQDSVMYYWKGSIDQNFTPVLGSSVDRISRVLLTAPAAWLGTQTNNTMITLLTPDNVLNEQVLDSWTVSEIDFDSGTNSPAYCNAQWDIEQTSGESNIWAQNNSGGFYLMEWDGVSQWLKASPTDFALTAGNIIKDIVFGVNSSTANPYMVTIERSTTLYTGIRVVYWELTGATRNDPASWTSSVIFNSTSTFLTLAGIWDTGSITNGFPVFRGLTYYKGDLYEFSWDGVSAWTSTQITGTGLSISSQENQCVKYFNFVNAIDGTTENEIILAAGRRGYNSGAMILAEYTLRS